MSTDLNQPPRQLVLARKADPVLLPGRRSFVKYRELGLTEFTKGAVRAQVILVDAKELRPTGWHYHTCEMQFLYSAMGWIDFEIDGMGKVRLEEGDSLILPGGVRHQELAASDGNEVVEVCWPAQLGTHPCDPPPGALPEYMNPG